MKYVLNIFFRGLVCLLICSAVEISVAAPSDPKQNIVLRQGRVAKIAYKTRRILVGFEKPKARDFAPGDKFYVLSTDNAEILAELEFLHRYKIDKYFVAKISQIPVDFPIEQLDRLAVFPVDVVASNEKRFSADLVEEFKAKIGKSTSPNTVQAIYNPTIRVGYIRSSSLFVTANVITGAKLDPMVAHNGFAGDFFIPNNDAVPWLNWLGVRGRYDLIQTGYVLLKRPHNDEVQKASFEGRQTSVSVSVRPTFQKTWLSALGFHVGVWNSRQEKMSLQEIDGIPESSFDIEVKSVTVGFEYENNPIPNVFITTMVVVPAQNSYTAKETSGSGTNGEVKGKWNRTEISIAPCIRYPVLEYKDVVVKLDASATLLRRIDTINAPALDDADKKAQKYDTWSYSGTLGLGVNL